MGNINVNTILKPKCLMDSWLPWKPRFDSDGIKIWKFHGLQLFQRNTGALAFLKKITVLIGVQTKCFSSMDKQNKFFWVSKKRERKIFFTPFSTVTAKQINYIIYDDKKNFYTFIKSLKFFTKIFSNKCNFYKSWKCFQLHQCLDFCLYW